MDIHFREAKQRFFAYFMQRYTKEEIEDLKVLVKLRDKLRSARFQCRI